LTSSQGTKKQVVLAGGIAGLVSRYGPPKEASIVDCSGSNTRLPSFCVAPLDVVKIRLQLQIHSLSDPASHRGVTGPIYKGTIPTMRAIVREEGLTVSFSVPVCPGPATRGESLQHHLSRLNDHNP